MTLIEPNWLWKRLHKTKWPGMSSIEPKWTQMSLIKLNWAIMR